MKLIDGKSVLLGMGIGIIIASILGFIFFLGYQPQLSNSEIIARAKNLGLTDNIAQNDGFIRNQDGSLKLLIDEGETASKVAEKLYSAGIINSSIEFELMLKKDNLQGSIKPGQYTINFDDDIKTIIDMITK